MKLDKLSEAYSRIFHGILEIKIMLEKYIMVLDQLTNTGPSFYKDIVLYYLNFLLVNLCLKQEIENILLYLS